MVYIKDSERTQYRRQKYWKEAFLFIYVPSTILKHSKVIASRQMANSPWWSPSFQNASIYDTTMIRRFFRKAWRYMDAYSWGLCFLFFIWFDAIDTSLAGRGSMHSRPLLPSKNTNLIARLDSLMIIMHTYIDLHRHYNNFYIYGAVQIVTTTFV